MDLGQFLVFIGTPAFVDYVISHVLDQIPKWNAWRNAQAKSIITLLLAIVFAVVSYVLVKNVTTEQIAQWQQLFTLVAAMFAAWASGEIQHNIVGPWASARRARLVARKLQLDREIKTLRTILAADTVKGVPVTPHGEGRELAQP